MENNTHIKISNVACPYCRKILTVQSFENGKGWICEHCQKLLTYEKFREFYENYENENR